MKRLDGKVAVVTGAGAGIGAAIGKLFAAEGASVVCADIDASAAADAAASIRAGGGAAEPIRADVSLEADCRNVAAAARARFGPVDILVNAAGIVVVGSALDLDYADWRRQQDVNLTGPFLMSKACLPHMIERNGGSIVMVASIAALRPSRNGVGYVASKHGLLGLTKALAIDHAHQSIRVNAICPGSIETAMVRGLAAKLAPQQPYDDYVKSLGAAHPLGRIGSPEDVARVALHFASDDASWTTGAVYTLDGGVTLGVRT